MLKSVAAAAVIIVATALSLSVATADDWTAVRLRGGVFALENGAWAQLLRGSVVSDDRVIKSAPDGRITLVRGAETIELGPDTTAQISDRSGFTTVYNHAGTVGIDAEARNVKHFAVQTSFLAAVVKGTAFTVQTSPTTSTVAVTRGNVEVDDEQSDSRVSVLAGQQVSSSEDTPITAARVIAAPASAPKPPRPAAQQPAVTSANPSSVDVGNSNAGWDRGGKFGRGDAGGDHGGNFGGSDAGGDRGGKSGRSDAGGDHGGKSGRSDAGGDHGGNFGRGDSGGDHGGNFGRGDSGGDHGSNFGNSDAGRPGGGHRK